MKAVHSGTLSNGSQTVVRIASTGGQVFSLVEVITRKGTAEIFYTVGFSPDSAADADGRAAEVTAAGQNDTFIFPANVTSPASVRQHRTNGGKFVTVKLWATGASEQVSVIAYSRGEMGNTW